MPAKRASDKQSVSKASKSKELASASKSKVDQQASQGAKAAGRKVKPLGKMFKKEENYT